MRSLPNHTAKFRLLMASNMGVCAVLPTMDYIDKFNERVGFYYFFTMFIRLLWTYYMYYIFLLMLLLILSTKYCSTHLLNCFL
jgi:hypothetical protein